MLPVKDKVILRRGRPQTRTGEWTGEWCMGKISHFYKNVIALSGFQPLKKGQLLYHNMARGLPRLLVEMGGLWWGT